MSFLNLRPLTEEEDMNTNDIEFLQVNSRMLEARVRELQHTLNLMTADGAHSAGKQLGREEVCRFVIDTLYEWENKSGMDEGRPWFDEQFHKRGWLE